MTKTPPISSKPWDAWKKESEKSVLPAFLSNAELWSDPKKYVITQVRGLAEGIAEVGKEVAIKTVVEEPPEAYQKLAEQIEICLRTSRREEWRKLREKSSCLDRDKITKFDSKITDEEMKTLSAFQSTLDKANPSGAPFPSKALKDSLRPAATIFSSLLHRHKGLYAHGKDAANKTMASLPCEIRELEAALTACKEGLAKGLKWSEAEGLFQEYVDRWENLKSNGEKREQFSSSKWETLEDFSIIVEGILDNPSLYRDVKIKLPEKDQKGVLKILESTSPEQGGFVQQVITKAKKLYVPSAPVSSKKAKRRKADGVSATDGSGLFDIDFILEKGKDLLSEIASSTGNAMASVAARKLAYAISLVFKKIKEHIEEENKHVHLLGQVDSLLKRLKLREEDGSWKKLLKTLKDCFDFIQDQQVWLQGFRLPLSSVRSVNSPIPDFLKIIEKHQSALHLHDRDKKTKVTDEMIQEQVNGLKIRTSLLGPSRVVIEKICGLETNPTFFPSLFSIDATRSVETLPEIVRARLFDVINRSTLNNFRKWFAKFSYDYLLLPLSSFYVHSILTNAFQLADTVINQDDEGSASKEIFLIKKIRNWLAVISGAYNDVAHKDPVESKDFFKMMEEALKDPRRNEGLTSRQVYAATAKTLLSVFGPKIKWVEKVFAYFNKVSVPSTSFWHFCNPVIKAANIVCGWALSAIFFVPQWLLNFVLQTVARIYLDYGANLEEVAEEKIESLRNRTPTSYAMHRLIYHQLEKTLHRLKKKLHEQKKPQGAQKESNLEKIELASLIEYGFEVLDKSYYRTQDRLKRHLNGTLSWRNQLESQMIQTFLPEAVEAMTTTAAVALQGMVRKKEMRELLYDTLQIANQSFQPQEMVSKRDFKNLEKGIREVADQILETALFHMIQEKCDFTRGTEKKELDTFYSTLKKDCSAFVKKVTRLRASLEDNPASTGKESKRNRAIHGKNYKKLLETTDEMVLASKEFHSGRLNALSNADGNGHLNAETKSKLSQLSQDLKKITKPFAEDINKIKKDADRIYSHQNWQKKLGSCRKKIAKIDHLLQKKEELSETEMGKIEERLKRVERKLIKKHRLPTKDRKPFVKYCRRMRNSLASLRKADQTETRLKEIFTLLKKLKTQEDSSEIAEALMKKTAQLPLEKQRVKLVSILEKWSASKSYKQKIAHLKTFRQHLDHTRAKVKGEKAELPSQMREYGHTILGHVEETCERYGEKIGKSKIGLDMKNEELDAHIKELRDWGKDQNPFPIWTLDFFDMHWVTDLSKNLAKEGARRKVNELFESLYQPYNYDSMVKQGIMLPLIRARGKRYMRKPGRTS